MLARIGIRFTPDECTMLLEENPNVFALVDGMYLTRAGAFTEIGRASCRERV